MNCRTPYKKPLVYNYAKAEEKIARLEAGTRGLMASNKNLVNEVIKLRIALADAKQKG